MNKPFKLSPAAKDYLWGGTRLKTEFGKNIDIDPLAETWECSTHPDGPSIVASGEYTGKTLTEVLSEHPEYLGIRALELTGGKPELPILVKLIDAAKDLSVQVHPDDEYALKYENSLGKTEMWYVLQATPDAKLVHGFNRDVTVEELRTAAEDGSIEQILNYVPVEKGDLFYIEAGTVHAIGAGALVAEIQENSNITYRLYDYNRVGKDGKKRELHVEKALMVVNREKMLSYNRDTKKLSKNNDGRIEQLKKCKYFSVNLLKVKQAKYLYNIDSFHVFLCIEGKGLLKGAGEELCINKGDAVFIPAGICSVDIVAKLGIELLDISCSNLLEVKESQYYLKYEDEFAQIKKCFWNEKIFKLLDDSTCDKLIAQEKRLGDLIKKVDLMGGKQLEALRSDLEISMRKFKNEVIIAYVSICNVDSDEKSNIN